ncbi:MAG: O-acetyl-ADP-ribose deacetylase [Candidatus Accumulibacter regalis]|jgi:O-acetyl-ADP-ribose deacetylase (regulator of RNase III)|uniref:O-acetyl-ADP-ribose deacetylase n=1 Tax=Accumulibacter regalis TaxID=522306 RepID=A0A011QKA2_ACCRE|nr:protein-ADP-ribose hydrolase [Accumulibacter sp.]EXI89802.1 MAG: O-acetyl-ADP-ribose deacetylase [Candidatus Accumulibacter regalis]MBN8513289.1 protein-ADP-ribose hydrolase [Accumulibacter sp.]MBO3702238.1 protein-ADP-ribose hydrolase [Accumulibacter sp.]HRE70615.1 protein-ADP-ribose hydrolase [Accumulibacter sp.]HRI92320.1 protein-ADP-ribose hydrolase [Accumulibacter sp.]
MKLLLHTDYADDLSLFEEYKAALPFDSEAEKCSALDVLLSAVKDPLSRLRAPAAIGYEDRRRLLHAALNILQPGFLKETEIEALNRLLQTELTEKKIVDVNDLVRNAKRVGSTRVSIFQGDITKLRIDSIVNAANNQMLGCFQPLHKCIDNAIHTAAGVQLRDDCDAIMRRQGFPEPTGQAKITRAYNLPSKFVLHTVGPIVSDSLDEESERQLREVYTNCLELSAAMPQIRSVAFCCVSTGVFGYPQAEAAEAAFSTVISWLQQHAADLDHVVFNVFTDKDCALYKKLMEVL